MALIKNLCRNFCYEGQSPLCPSEMQLRLISESKSPGLQSLLAQINTSYYLLQSKTNFGLSLLVFIDSEWQILFISCPNLDRWVVAAQRYTQDSNAFPRLQRKKRHRSNNIWHNCRMESYSIVPAFSISKAKNIMALLNNPHGLLLLVPCFNA